MSHKSASFAAVGRIGIDLGKNRFHLVGLDQRGAIVLQLKGSRAQVERRLADIDCGTSVWTGRALQAGSDDLEIIGLALLYPALEWSVRAPGHHGYPRASVLIRV